MATPVVTVASGGLPVTDVTSTSARGLPITEALNGRGTAVTKVASGGMPVVYSTVADYPSGGGGLTPGVEATAFLARTSGLDTTHTNAYTALINGLVADGIWSKLDVLHIYATQDSTTALLNLVSTSFNGIANGSPTFTVNRGFNGVDVSSTVWIDTQFNTSSIAGRQYTLNSAHLALWNVTTTASPNNMFGATDNVNYTNVLCPKASADSKIYVRIHSGFYDPVPLATDASGFFVGSRTTINNVNGYRNASSVYSTTGQTATASALINFNYYTLAMNNAGTAAGCASQMAMASIGGGLTPTDVTNFYNRLRTYMTAVGVP
jgi:hypothetical protein